ncbi:formin-like protein 20 [Sorghum bicolor]|uniref:formin-like protein 20 n=1 Tax=Sorghum bicolor TaxID=4558 RepID=UPI000B42436F|nr:formin-like protein 20 [Sorghum bicolor]|eukprot:XP_021309091.1 formin-like protein 20 [Sorghum bicolor]
MLEEVVGMGGTAVNRNLLQLKRLKRGHHFGATFSSPTFVLPPAKHRPARSASSSARIRSRPPLHADLASSPRGAATPTPRAARLLARTSPTSPAPRADLADIDRLLHRRGDASSSIARLLPVRRGDASSPRGPPPPPSTRTSPPPPSPASSPRGPTPPPSTWTASPRGPRRPPRGSGRADDLARLLPARRADASSPARLLLPPRGSGRADDLARLLPRRGSGPADLARLLRSRRSSAAALTPVYNTLSEDVILVSCQCNQLALQFVDTEEFQR